MARLGMRHLSSCRASKSIAVEFCSQHEQIFNTTDVMTSILADVVFHLLELFAEGKVKTQKQAVNVIVQGANVTRAVAEKVRVQNRNSLNTC